MVGEQEDSMFERMTSQFQHEIYRRDTTIDNLNALIAVQASTLMIKNKDILEAYQKNKAILEENRKYDEMIKFHKERETYLSDFIFKHTGLKIEDLDEFMTEEKYNNYLLKKKKRAAEKKPDVRERES